MAKEPLNIRAKKSRKKLYDRIQFVVPKGGRALIHARALQERTTDAEIMRRAILQRCGLEKWPGENQAAALDKCQDQQTAQAEIRRMQLTEYVASKPLRNYMVTDAGLIPDPCTTIILKSKVDQDDYIKAMLNVLDAVEDMDLSSPDAVTNPAPIPIEKKDLLTIYRLLSNIYVPDAPREELDDDDEDDFSL